MMRFRPAIFLPVLFALFALSACGPILGLLSKATEGTSLRDTAGNPADIKTGGRLLILSPFPKTKEGFHIVRGEDERNFADEFGRLGLFKAESVTMETRIPDDAKAASSKSPAELKAEFGLSAEPDVLLTGTLLSRKTYVAPLRSVIMSVSWRLVFTDLRSGKSWTVVAESKEPFEDNIPHIVERIAARLGR